MKYLSRTILFLSVFFISLNSTGQHGWTVNANEYYYNGTVTAVVINGGSEVTTGTLGAFVGGTCRGFADGITSPLGNTIFLVICFSNQASGETLTFKYYSSGSFYDINETVPFIDPLIAGDAFNPLQFHITTCNAVTIGAHPANTSACLGSVNASFSVVANGSSPFTYQWQYFNGSAWSPVTNGIPSGAIYIGEATATLGVSGITSTGNYQYRCFITNCSSANNATSNAATLTVNSTPSQPTITPSGPTTFCSGGSVILTSSAGTSYLWSTGATTQSIDVETTGSYSVQVANASGCQSVPSNATAVTVNALPATPTITASGPTTFCAGGSVTLTSSAGNSYQWSNGETTQIINVTESGNYTVRVTNSNGCQSLPSAVTAVTVYALPSVPTISATGPTNFCIGGSVTLTSSAGNSYIWSTGATTQSINVNTSGSYTVRVTNANGCLSLPSAGTLVTVNSLPPAPTISASGATTFCAGGSVTLTSSTGNSYLWSTGATTPGINVTISGNYTVRVTDTNGCQSLPSDVTSVMVNALPAAPTITASGTTTFCIGGSVTLTSGAASGYLWSTGATSQSINVIASGSYTVRVTDINECQSLPSTATVVTVNALPVVDAGSDKSIPYGTSTTLDGTVTGTGPFTYSWTPASLLVNPASVDPTTVNLTSTNVFNLTATSTSTGCSNSDAVTVSVTGGALSTTPTATPGTICVGESVQLDAGASGGSGTYTYLWSSVPAGFSSTLAKPTATPTANTTYSVIVDDGFSSVNGQISVTVNALPVQPTITPSGPTTFCSGGSVILTSSAGTSYLWSTGATTPSINVTTSGSYTVQVTNASGCQSIPSATTTVTVNALPATPTISASGPTTFCAGGNVSLTSSAGSSYLWSNGATTQIINVTASGSYTVRVTDANGCQSLPSSARAVTVYDLPSAPTISASGPTNFCIGGSVTLTSSEGTSYLWSTGAISQSINVNASGIYNVSVTNSNGCQSLPSAGTLVTVNSLPPVPTISASGATTFCAGGSVTLTSSTGNSYLWSTGATTPGINITTTGNYTVRVTDTNGCQSLPSDVTSVTVNALPAAPTITASGTTTFCIGGSVTLTSGAASGYLWSTGATSQSINVSISGSYTVRVTDTNECQSLPSAATVVTVNALPVVDAGTDRSIPYGTSTTLDGTVTGTGPFTYSWTPASLLVNPASVDPTTVILTSTNVFNLTATSTSTGCSNSNAVTVSVTGGALSTTPTATPGTICIGETIQLDAGASGGSGIYTYLWSSVPAGFSSTLAKPTATPTANTTYSVTVDDGFSAVNGQVSVTVNALPAMPTITASGATTFCSGGSVTLTSSPGSSYLWSTGATTPSIDVTTSGTYSVRVTNANGCQSVPSNATSVTVNALPATPTITASGPTTFCAGGSVTLTSSAGSSYLWSNGATTQIINVNSSGSYTVRVTNASGCQSLPSSATSVTVYSLPATPTITASGPTSFCTGGSVTLTSSPGTSYLWSTGATTQSIDVNTSGTYTVRVTNASGCLSSPSAGTLVTVNSLPQAPTITASGPTTFCSGGSVTLTSSSGSGYLWSTGATTQSINVTSSGNYTVRITDTNGCQSLPSAVTSVTVNALPATPTITASGPTTFCIGGSVTLTSSAGTNYLWSTGATTQSINVSASGSYTVRITNSNGCQSSLSAATVVTVNLLPIVDAGPNVSIPYGTTTTLDGTVTGTGPFTYSWTPASLLVNPASVDPATVNLTSTTIFTLTATSASTGCSNSNEVTVTVTGGALSTTPTATPGTICAGESLQLDAGASGGSGTYTYLWSSVPAGFSSTLAKPTATPTANTTYSVTVDDGFFEVNGQVSVTVNALPAMPTITAIGETTFCAGGSVTLTSSTGSSYLWSTGATSPGINVTTSGSYTVQVTNASGCLSVPSNATAVTVNALPATPTITASGPTTFCAGGSVTLTSSAGATYLWSNGATTQIINVTATGSYTVRVTSSNGCQSPLSAATAVTVYALPSVPTITASGPTTFCIGGNVTLTSSPGTSYLWSTGETTQSIAVNTSGNYTVRVTNANGCLSLPSAGTLVTVNSLPPVPTISASGATTFCAGGSVTLTSGTGISYLWSTGATTQSINVSTTGNYTVRVTDSNGCQSLPSAVTSVTVNALPATPTITASGPITFCIGGSVTLTSSAGTSYLWSTGATTQSINVSTAGSYTVRITNSNGCQSLPSTATVITVNALPVVDAGTNISIANGTSTTLNGTVTGTGPFTYSWTPASLLVNPALVDPTTVILNSTTVFTLTATSTSTGCSNSDMVTVSVTGGALSASPTAVPGTICIGESVQLNAGASGGSGTYTYSWTSVPAGFSSTLANPTAIPTANTTYSVAVNDGFSTVNGQVSVKVNALPARPTITASGATTFCVGGSVTLTSSAGSSYLWSTGATTQSINVTTSGSYTVQVTNASGCQSVPSAATIVTVNALPAAPVITASGPTTFCIGGNVTLTSSAGTSYLWSTGATSQSINVTTSGSYTVRVTNSNGCQSLASSPATVTVNALPVTPTITASGPTTFCIGGSVTLTSSAGTTYLWSTGATTQSINVSTAGSFTVRITNANGCQSLPSAATVITVNALPVVDAGPNISIANGTSTTLNGTVTGTGPFTYSWTPASLLVNPALVDPTTVILNSTTVFTLTATSTSTGCSNSDVVTVTVTGGPLSSTPKADPGTICAGESVQLDAGASGGSGTYTYSWSSVPAGFTSTLAQPTTTPTVNTTYSVTVNDGFSSVNGQVSVTVNALPARPTITASGATTFCAGGSVTLTSSAGSSYLWSTGATTQSINVNISGSYTVQVTNASGCQSVPSVATTVTVNALPATPTINASGPITFCAGGSVILTSSAGTSYLWSNGATTQSINVNTSGSFTVRVTNSNGCQSLPSSTTTVTVNALPETPTISASGPTTFCVGSNVTLTSSTGTSYLWSTGATTQSINVSTSGNYSVRITNSNGCQSAVSGYTVVTVYPLPTAPSIGTITPPTCTSSTGSVILNGLPSSGTWTVNGSPGGIIRTGEGTSTTVTNLVANTYTFTVTVATGCTSPVSASAVIPAQPATPTPPVVGTITPPTCTLSTGSVVLSGLPATGTWTLSRYPGPSTTTGNGTSTTISGIPSGTYNFTVTSQAGCVSLLSANVVMPAQPPTPTAPSVGTITPPTCTVPTGSVILSSLPAGTWTINPGSVTGSTSSTTISGLVPGTYNFTVTNSNGCTSPATVNVVITPQPGVPTAPVLGLTSQPTCTVATGSVALSGLPSSGAWTLIRNPGTVTTFGSGSTTTVTGLVPGTYTFTVTNASGCTSVPSGNVVINTQPSSPANPVTSVNCNLGAGQAIVTVTSPTGAGLEYRIDAGAYQTGTTFNGVVNGNHTITVRNSFGCTTTGQSFPVTCDCGNPPTITLSSNTGNTCGTTAITVNNNTFGGSATSVTITENGGGSVIPTSTSTTPFAFIYTPNTSDAGKTVIITVTTNNPEGVPCTASSATYTLTVSAVPTAPAIGTRTQPTCLVATGSVTLSGLPSTGTWILTRSPDNVITSGTGTSTTVSGLIPGTYNFTVTNANGCTSASSANVVINVQPPTPEAPVPGIITQPTCAVSNGSVVLNGLPSTGNWTVTRSPGGVTKTGTGTSTTVTTIPPGTYTFTVTNSNNCMSAPTSEIVIDPQPATPSAPSAGTITPPSCTVTTGSVILLGLPSSGTWTLTRFPGTITSTGTGTTTTVSGLASGTYNFTVTSSSGCTSLPSANIVIPVQPPTPAAPIIGTITHPSFTVATGSVALSGLPSSGTWILTRNPDGITLNGTGTTRTVSGLEPGTYTFTVTNAVGCVSASSAIVLINARPGPPTVIITDPDTICSTSTANLTLPAVTEGSTENLTFTYWLDAAATIEYSTPESATAGTYYIKGTTTAGYFTIKSVIVTEDQMPVANAGSDMELEYVFGTELNAETPLTGTGVWSVFSGNGDFTDENDPTTTITGLSLNENILLWSVTNGVCPPALDYIMITVHDLVIPTLITPNFDSRNDFFVLQGLETLGKTELTIFDRRGLKVYEDTDYQNDWDGVDYNSNPLPDDTYFYVLKSANGKALNGFIVVRR